LTFDVFTRRIAIDTGVSVFGAICFWNSLNFRQIVDRASRRLLSRREELYWISTMGSSPEPLQFSEETVRGDADMATAADSEESVRGEVADRDSGGLRKKSAGTWR
uniref:Ammonium_transp domain-containing protein n=1 Tax=Gongylonema pulchrum TaxID=637853 RepID=A0A183EGI7_9BILA